METERLSLFGIDAKRIRVVAKEIADRDLSTEEAQAFLGLFGEQLDAELTKALRANVYSHFEHNL